MTSCGGLTSVRQINWEWMKDNILHTQKIRCLNLSKTKF